MSVKLFFLIILPLSIFASDIIGLWNLSNKEQPFNCCALVGYDAKFEFKEDGRIFHLNGSKNMINTNKYYELEGNTITFYLKPEGSNALHRFIMKMSSATKTFELTNVYSNYYKAVDVKSPNNTFQMCKK
jgi:hypothetical protein